jgi:hypothetical protein
MESITQLKIRAYELAVSENQPSRATGDYLSHEIILHNAKEIYKWISDLEIK